ncbi:MAG: AzlD domain-containing protein [Symbiopectobacterium sp.]|uniref:AzlD domain-containing protein n=1 Tax=Symbiopectobacterium sp. TaxID=2952789 RepID=UPI0039E8CA81
MSGTLLFALAGIVFLNRYLFLEPRLPIRLPGLIQQALKYSAPCLLTAICGPIILLDHGIMRSFDDNPYLWGALFSVIIAFFVRNMLLAVILSLIFFALLLSL